jgi:hypothetical protein
MVDIFGNSSRPSQADAHIPPEVLNRVARQDFVQQNFFSNNTNDQLITRDRGVLFREPAYFMPPQGSAQHNWTADGPSRSIPTFRFNRNVRPLVGGGHRDMWGQHTNIDAARQNQLEGKPRMRPARQSQLTVQRYRGQSYSATTQLAGQ